MSCGELERLFLAGAPEQMSRAHRQECVSCASLGSDLESAERILSGLRPPAAPKGLIAVLKGIPSRTVNCEAADLLAAAEVEGELSPPDQERLAFHRSRCEACAEAAGILRTSRELASPAPAPWVMGRLAATRPEKKKRSSFWSLVASPKGAIALAYAAAVVVMFSGFNPADLARKAGVARLEETAKTSAESAGRTLGDRIGAFEEEAVRRLAVWKGVATGYGRAAITRAIQLVMKTETQPPPRPGKSGEEKGMLNKDEIQDVARLTPPQEELKDNG
ncbi:MAG TPA: hypothetical protein VKH43_10215 [Thermoanaerobaculia bacterium]|nr:hypothetical protein [Thermoanaerobaculia bacterium]